MTLFTTTNYPISSIIDDMDLGKIGLPDPRLEVDIVEKRSARLIGPAHLTIPIDLRRVNHVPHHRWRVRSTDVRVQTLCMLQGRQICSTGSIPP